MPLDSETLLGDVTDTARWVAHYRALETRRGDALFRDPFAERLAGDRGRRIVERLPGADAAAPANIVRTVLIDHAIESLVAAGLVDTVLNLGAGFDTRPQRLPLPSTLRWIEVDLPALVEEKEALLADVHPVCRLERIGGELADADVRSAVVRRLGDGAPGRSLVLTEGVLDYLPRESVATLAGELAGDPAFGWWLLDLLSPASLQQADALWGEPLRAAGSTKHFAPAEGPAFFAPFGWRPLDLRSIEGECRRLGRAPRHLAARPTSWMSSITYFVAVVLLGRSHGTSAALAPVHRGSSRSIYVSLTPDTPSPSAPPPRGSRGAAQGET